MLSVKGVLILYVASAGTHANLTPDTGRGNWNFTATVAVTRVVRVPVLFRLGHYYNVDSSPTNWWAVWDVTTGILPILRILSFNRGRYRGHVPFLYTCPAVV